MSQESHKDQHIEGSSIEDSPVQFGQAEGNVVQIQGSGNQVIIQRSERNTTETRKPLSRQDYRHRQILLNKVRNSWVKGVLENSLYKRAQLELGLEERWDALDLDYATSEKPRQPLPKGTRALDKFDELGAGCTLLILGEPGAGKTTTLLELARDLIARAEQDVQLPIPVVFNLSSWAVFKGIARKPPTLKDWLMDELNTKYQVSKALAKTWLTNQDLLLLLDGLDEVRADQRDACVQAINDFHQEHGLTEIVVCSRLQDYENLANRLRFQGAIFIQPLTREQVEAYLDNAGDNLAGVKAVWEADLAFQELTQTPLMLSVMAFAYEGITYEDLSRITLEARKEHLWDKYVNRMLVRKKLEKIYSPNQVTNRLAFLAKKMSQESQTLFLIEKMQPTWLSNNCQRLFYWGGTSILLGSIYGFFLIVLQFLVHGQHSPEYWLYPLKLSLIFCIITCLLENLINGSVAGITGGVLLGLSSTFIIGITRGFQDGIILGLADWSFYSGYFWLIGWGIINLNNMSEPKKNPFFETWFGLVFGLFSGLIGTVFLNIKVGLFILVIGVGCQLLAFLIWLIAKVLRPILRSARIHPSIIYGLALFTSFCIGSVRFDEVAVFYGIIGFLFGLRREGINPLPTLRISWQGVRKGMVIGLVVGICFGFFAGFLSEFLGNLDVHLALETLKNFAVNSNNKATVNELEGLEKRPIFVWHIFFWVILPMGYGILQALFCLIPAMVFGGLISGIKDTVVEQTFIPNQAIKRTANYSLIFALAGGIIFLPMTWVMDQFVISEQGYGLGIENMIFWWSRGLLIGWLIFGIIAIQHFILRIILFIRGAIPWNYARFLDWCSNQLLLQRVGRGYIFVHRSLMEHFAQMEQDSQNS